VDTVPTIQDIGVEGAGVDVADAERGEAAVSWAYRPWLDGLRAIAVYLVVLFHAGNGKFTGGYVGVDVFFVLSGYLVTQLLLRDLTGVGRIRFGRFYARRVRRLLPAAFVALLVSAIVWVAIASPVEVADAVGSFKAAFLYVTNWYFIHHASGYFGADITTNPVLQYWSLAIEEQFYLLWPLALGGLFFATRRLDPARRRSVIAAIVAAGALASAVWALALRHTNPNRAYYGTDARAYELMAGAVLALVPAILSRASRSARTARLAAIVTLGALLVLASSWTHLDAIERGIAVTIVTCGFLVAIETAQGGIVQRALSHPTIVYLGRISYGTYLWHWIVILVAIRTFHLGSTTTLIVVLVSTALASLSFQLLEHPVRASTLLDRHRRAVVVTGLVASVVGAVVVIPQVVDASAAHAPTIQGSTAGFTKTPALDWEAAKSNLGPFTNCYKQPVSKCTIVHGGRPSILLIGDSHAHMLIPTLSAIAEQQHLTLSVSVRGGCPWQQRLFAVPLTVNGVAMRKEDCKAQKNDLYDRVIPELHPDVIVAMNVAHEDKNAIPFLGPHGEHERNGSPTSIRWLRQTTDESVAKLRAGGSKVVLLEPIPVAPIDPLDCLSRSTYLEACRYVAGTTPDPVQHDYRQLARRDSGVTSVDLDRLVCPYFPICDPIVDGQIVKWDPTHLTVAFARSIAPPLDAYLTQTGVLPK
jgi:peptidoglycan/LPS O-acetylase OafA/YrhL